MAEELDEQLGSVGRGLAEVHGFDGVAEVARRLGERRAGERSHPRSSPEPYGGIVSTGSCVVGRHGFRLAFGQRGEPVHDGLRGVVVVGLSAALQERLVGSVMEERVPELLSQSAAAYGADDVVPYQLVDGEA